MSRRKKVAIPRIFGRGVRERTLILLSANGPLRTGQLVEAIGCDEKKIHRALRHFESLGIVARRGKTGRRTHWTLDRRFIAFDELRRLLAILGKSLVERPELPCATKRHGGPTFRLKNPDNPPLHLLFGSEMRTRTLLGVAAMPNVSVMNVATTIGYRYESVHYCVRSLQKQGLCAIKKLGREQLVCIDTSQSAGRALQALLVKLARFGSF